MGVDISAFSFSTIKFPVKSLIGKLKNEF